MKSAKSRLKKIFLITAGIILLIVVVVILCISPITKYLVEKYSVKYTGRQIKMDWAYVNPFTGHIYLSNLKIYESLPADSSERANGDSIFLSMDGISVNFNLHKLLSKEYEITSITLYRPKGIAFQKDKSTFNFSDVINRFSSPSPADGKPSKPPTHFNMLNIEIKDGIFYLKTAQTHINYFIKDFDFESAGLRWNADTLPGKFSFSPGTGSGKVNGNFTINISNLDYRFFFIIQKLNLSIIDQYLKEMTNYGTFSAMLDARINAKGNFRDGENIDVTGRTSINNFHFGKTPAEDYASFDTLVLAMDEINPKQQLYHLDSLTLSHPYFKFEKYDYLDNAETIFGEKGNKVSAVSTDNTRFNLILTLGHFFATLSKNFFKSTYKINRLAVNRADFEFNDFSTSEEFSIATSPLNIKADSIDKSNRNVQISLSSGIQPYGNINITANINPRDSADFDLNYHFGKIPVSLFNPYLITFTSFPLDRGTLELNGAWKVRNGILQSENHLLIVDPFEAKRLKNKADKWIPVWLVMFFTRERSNVIDYQIPITGNLKNPDFHLGSVILKAVKNLFVKPVTAPYILKVNTVEENINKSLALKWGMRQSTVTPLQERFIEKIADFLAKNPDASVSVVPQQYEAKEKEYILFFEAKKKYYLSLHPEKANNKWQTEDSECVDKMSVKDSLFVHYLNKQLTRELVFTIQDKCRNIVSPAIVNEQFNLLNKSRENTFMSYFKKKGVDGRVTIKTPQNTIPYNGFSFYQLEYKGEFPDYLVKAYKEIDELNNEAPRVEYKKERNNIKGI